MCELAHSVHREREGRTACAAGYAEEVLGGVDFDEGAIAAEACGVSGRGRFVPSPAAKGYWAGYEMVGDLPVLASNMGHFAMLRPDLVSIVQSQ